MEERSFSSSEEAVPLSHVTLGLDLSLPLQSMIGAHSKQLPPSKNSTSGWWFVPLLLTPMGLPVVGCDKVTKGKYWWALRASLAFRVVPQETTPLVPLTHLTPLETSLYLLTRCMSLVWESVCVCGGCGSRSTFPWKDIPLHNCCPLNEKSSSTHSRLEVFCRGPTMSFQLLLLFNEFLLVSVVSFIWTVQSFLWLSSCFLSTWPIMLCPLHHSLFSTEKIQRPLQKQHGAPSCCPRLGGACCAKAALCLLWLVHA